MGFAPDTARFAPSNRKIVAAMAGSCFIMLALSKASSLLVVRAPRNPSCPGNLQMKGGSL